jgi:hypothetical protein
MREAQSVEEYDVRQPVEQYDERQAVKEYDERQSVDKLQVRSQSAASLRGERTSKDRSKTEHQVVRTACTEIF